MSIHAEIIQAVVSGLNTALITQIDPTDPALAGVVTTGPLQGNPDPDVARISVTVHENDPDAVYGSPSGSGGSWNDVIEETECGGGITWRRRFTVKARCLLVNTAEDLSATRSIASTLRHRIESALLGMSFSAVSDAQTGEYVSRGIFGDALSGEMVQAGGPPDAYDYHIKVKFEVFTSRRL